MTGGCTQALWTAEGTRRTPLLYTQRANLNGAGDARCDTGGLDRSQQDVGVAVAIDHDPVAVSFMQDTVVKKSYHTVWILIEFYPDTA